METARQTVEEGDDRIYNGKRKYLRSMKRFYSIGSSADDMAFGASVSEPPFKKRRLPPPAPPA